VGAVALKTRGIEATGVLVVVDAIDRSRAGPRRR